MVTSLICTSAQYSESITVGKVYVCRQVGLYQDLYEFEDDTGNTRVINKEFMGIQDIGVSFEPVRHKEKRDAHNHTWAACGVTFSRPKDTTGTNNLQRDWEGVTCPDCKKRQYL